MADRDDLIKRQALDHHLEVAKLLREAVRRARWLVRCTEAKEVNRNRPAASRDEMRNEVIVNVQVVRKAVQHHESRSIAGEVADIDASTVTLNPVFGERRKRHVLGIRHGFRVLRWAGCIRNPNLRFRHFEFSSIRMKSSY